MSTDWFLYSPSKKKAVMIGSNGFSGVKVWPTDFGGVEFIRQIIDDNITDVVVCDENHLPDDLESE